MTFQTAARYTARVRRFTYLCIAASVVALWPLPQVAVAGHAGEQAAALKDEEAECRYILDLCSLSKRRDEEATAATRAVEQNSTGENVDRYRDAFIDAEIAYSELFEAARVIRKKHPEAPECFRQCSLIDQRLH